MNQRPTTSNQPRTQLPTVAIACALATLLGILVLSGQQAGIVPYRLLSDGLVCVLWLVAMTSLGVIALRLCSRKKIVPQNALTWVISAALGIGFTSLLLLMLGLIGWLNWMTAWAVIAIGLFCLVARLTVFGKHLADSKRGAKRDPSNPWRWMWLLATPALSIAMIAAVFPPGVLWGDEPNGYDVLEYHLQVPREWYEAGRITSLPHNVFSFMPMNVEMHYLLAMHLRGGPWAGMYLAQMMHLAMMALFIATIYAIVAESAGPPAGVIAALSAVAMPWTILLAPIAYDEAGLLLFGALTIGLSWRLIRDPAHCTPRSWLLVGIFCGLACGVKLTAIPMLALPIAITLPFVLQGKRRFTAPLVFALGTILTASPWLIRNIVWAHNPFFPEATEVFGSGGRFTDVQQERWRLAHTPPPAQRSIQARLRAAGDQIVWDWRYGFILIPGALLAAAISARSRETWFLLALLLMFAVIWIGFTHLQSRFFVLASVVIALLISSFPARWRAAVASFVIIAIVIGVVNWISHYALKLHKDDRSIFVEAQPLLGLNKLDFLTTDTSSLPDSVSLGLVGDARAFVYSRPMSHLRYRTVFDITDAWTQPADVQLLDPNEIRRLSSTYYQLPPPPLDIANRNEPFLIAR